MIIKVTMLWQLKCEGHTCITWGELKLNRWVLYGFDLQILKRMVLKICEKFGEFFMKKFVGTLSQFVHDRLTLLFCRHLLQWEWRRGGGRVHVLGQRSLPQQPFISGELHHSSALPSHEQARGHAPKLRPWVARQWPCLSGPTAFASCWRQFERWEKGCVERMP